MKNVSAQPSERTSVKISSIDPVIPQQCVKCLSSTPDTTRHAAFRRSDKTVERVVAVQWPYCSECLKSLTPLKHAQRWMTLTGFGQMVWVLYAVGASLDYYNLWWPSIILFAALFFIFIKIAKKTRHLWDLEWARIEEVYKGGHGAQFSFLSPQYAKTFAAANQH